MARRLTPSERRDIARERAKGVPSKDLAVRFGVSPQAVNATARALRDAHSVVDADTFVVGVRVSLRTLRALDATASRHGLTRAAALRRLITAAGPLLSADPEVPEALRALAAQINRVGLNLNQVAKSLNEAVLKGERVTYGEPSRKAIRAVTLAIFEAMEQVQDMARGQRRDLDLALAAALRDEAGDASA